MKEGGTFFAIALFLLMLFYGYIESQGGFIASGQSVHTANAQPASGSSIVGGPSLSADAINQVLTNAGSPAQGTGQSLHDLSSQYGVDDAFALAVFKHESNYGKFGVAHSSLSLGNLRCIPDAACVNGYAYFNSWQDGYQAFYKLISGPLYVGSGLTTPEQILTKYAPSEDNNNPAQYAADVEQSVASWRAA